MREVDRLMVDQIGVSLLQMMENAGCCLALQARRMLAGRGGKRWRRARRGQATQPETTRASAEYRCSALDLPSGLDPDSGQALEPAIRAAATLTLALPKSGLLEPAARPWVGDLYVADISVPPAVYQAIGLEVGPIFAASDVIKV